MHNSNSAVYLPVPGCSSVLTRQGPSAYLMGGGGGGGAVSVTRLSCFVESIMPRLGPYWVVMIKTGGVNCSGR